jgi:hypothetical protein
MMRVKYGSAWEVRTNEEYILNLCKVDENIGCKVLEHVQLERVRTRV